MGAKGDTMHELMRTVLKAMSQLSNRASQIKSPTRLTSSDYRHFTTEDRHWRTFGNTRLAAAQLETKC